MGFALLQQALEEIVRFRTLIQSVEADLEARKAPANFSAITNQSKGLTSIFKQLAAAPEAKAPENRQLFQQFSADLKDLLVRVNNIRLQSANLANGTSPAPTEAAASPAAPATAPVPAVSSVSSVTPVQSAIVAPEEAPKQSTEPVASPPAEPAPQQAASTPPSTEAPTPKTRKFALKGWLRKQGEVGLKSWKRRYFRFKDGKLLYFAEQDDLKPKGWIDLGTMISCAIDEAEKFSVTCTNRVWHLQAEKERDAQNWVKGLQLWAQKNQVLSNASSAVPTSPAAVAESANPALQLPEVEVAKSVEDAIKERRRLREEESMLKQKEREIREKERLRKMTALPTASTPANESPTGGHSPRAVPPVPAVLISPADIERLQQQLARVRASQADADKVVHGLSEKVEEMRKRTKPLVGLPIIMQLQARLATHRDTIRQTWTPAVQQYHAELAKKQDQVHEIRSKSRSMSSDTEADQRESLLAAWEELEFRSKSIDSALNTLAYNKMCASPVDGIPRKEQLANLQMKREIWVEALSANQTQLNMLETKDDDVHIGASSRVAKIAELILTRRAQLLLARAQFQQLRMRCNMGWTGSSVVPFTDEMQDLSTEYAQLLVTNVKLHLLQQTGSLPKINIDKVFELLKKPEVNDRKHDWPKIVADYIYSQVPKQAD